MLFLWYNFAANSAVITAGTCQRYILKWNYLDQKHDPDTKRC